LGIAASRIIPWVKLQWRVESALYITVLCADYGKTANRHEWCGYADGVFPVDGI
jgi:hypothetical protein